MAMSSQNQIPSGSAILLRFSDILRPQVLAYFQTKFQSFLNELPSYLMTACEGIPDGQQQAYLDIIVLLRHRRDDINARVTGLFNEKWQNFQQLAHPPQEQGTPVSALSMDSIGLVGSDELELNVVIETVSTRLLHQADQVITDAFNRLSALLPALKYADQLPFHPKVLLHLVPECFGDNNLSTLQKTVLLKQFSTLLDMREVVSMVGHALEQAEVPVPVVAARVSEDSSFVEEEEPDLVDVLRDIRDLNQKNAGGGSADGKGGSNSSGQVTELNTDPNSPLLQTTTTGGIVVDPARLVQQAAHFAQISQSVASVPLMPQNIFPLAQEQLIATTELMTRLSKLQDIQPLTPVAVNADIPSVAEVREHIRGQLQNDEDTVEMIGQKDTDIINLVSAMFDYILDDQDLPTAMKALIGRLQIPMLKVALLDDQFFKTEKHPARLLLNSLAKAGVGWDEKAQASDILYKKIEETVFKILTDFSSDMALFVQLLADFNKFYEEQQVRIALIDQRTREAEERRAKAELARSEVQLVLNQKLTGRRLPMAVIRLLQEGWRHVLYLSFLKDGKEAESWRQAVKVVDALIWSMMPVKEDAAWLERLKSVAPKLSNSLKKGLVSVNFDPIKSESLLREIERVHQETIDGLETPVVEILTEDQDVRADGVDRISVDQAVSGADSNVRSVVLPKSELVDLYQGETLPASDKYVQMVKHLKVGAWIEFSATDQLERHKLVARIRSMEKLIFANRRGIKVAEMSQMHLAVEFSQGRARLVDDQPQIIDRALQSVVGGLNQLTA
ncbi:DUF1631 family protein [Alkanindiges hydrocarboniclasticus]|jgi:hypothetical protein|uniref:DUF1631 family protein n=1 Tax=Alkanindiges hydrocarboniclasticus TaxID=1907941 RepID=UPI0009F85170|nr:DUF1631 family protein [Alkanindiges hydrocarboniclasticus]